MLKEPNNLVKTLAILITAIWLVISGLVLFNIIGTNLIGKILIYLITLLFLAYAIYVGILIYFDIKEIVLAKTKGRKIIGKIFHKYDFRTVLFGFCSALINLFMLAYYLGFTIFHFNTMFLALSIYYGLLFIARENIIYVFYRHSKNKYKEISVYMMAGILLTLLPLYIVISMREYIFNDNTLAYSNIHVFVMAVMAFYKLILGIYNYKKARKTNDLTTISLRNINLSEALISLFAFEQALMVTFSDRKLVEDVIIRINVGTAVVVTILTILIGISMMIRTKKERIKAFWEDGIYGLANFYSKREEKRLLS